MYKFLVFAFFSTFSLHLNAQVKGTVIDSATNKGIYNASVGLVDKQKAADTIYTLTAEGGEFKFDSVPAGNFSLILRAEGYTPVAKFVNSTSSQSIIDIGKISMPSLTKVLGEIVVEAAPITIKE